MKKKYIEDAYTHSFSSSIINTISYENGKTAIALEHTFFYPEGGGQPSDLGSIDIYTVEDVQIIDDEIFHIISEPIKSDEAEKLIGKSVSCKLNWEHRFTLMQQHSGQHILSASAEKLYDANTIGFHIGADYITIDLDKRLTETQAADMEALANKIVFENKKILAHYPSEEELIKMPLRKQPKVAKDIRVIEVEQFDFSPCGGTHVNRTGEIGIIKIKKIEAYKQGIRVEFVCGSYAISCFEKRNKIVNTLISKLSVQEHEILTFIDQLLEKTKQSKKEISLLREELVKMEVTSIHDETSDLEGLKVIRLSNQNIPKNDLRLKSQLICAQLDYIALLTGEYEGKTNIIISRSKNSFEELNMMNFIKTYSGIYGIKGGGTADSAQGEASTAENAEAFFDKIENDISSFL